MVISQSGSSISRFGRLLAVNKTKLTVLHCQANALTQVCWENLLREQQCWERTFKRECIKLPNQTQTVVLNLSLQKGGLEHNNIKHIYMLTIISWKSIKHNALQKKKKNEMYDIMKRIIYAIPEITAIWDNGYHIYDKNIFSLDLYIMTLYMLLKAHVQLIYIMWR